MIITLNDKLKELDYNPTSTGQIIDILENKKTEYVNKGKTVKQSLFYIEDNIEGKIGHKNYVEYLLAAWDSHYGIVVSPDIIWYLLQCELTSIVATNAETYRDLFTTSKEKKTITIQSNSLTVMPLDALMQALIKEIPSEVTSFLPEFSTSSQRAIFARFAAFADMVSPYYNYCMYCCGFPAIDVRGDQADWAKLHYKWKCLGKMFSKHQDYISRVDNAIAQICGSLNDADFWRDMFNLDRCGSGHQYEVSGWLTNLYLQEPDTRFPENYPSHVSLVAYKQLNTQKDYEMKSGLLASKKEGSFLIPDFAHIIYEKRPEVTMHV
jgi:hypothetical protein